MTSHPRVLAIEAVLAADSPFVPEGYEPVSRTIAIREDQTLEQLHEALRLAFGWADAHLYCYWVGTRFWDRDAVRYSAPFELKDDENDTRVPLAHLQLKRNAKLAYLFDYGDEWRLRLRVVDTWPADDACYPMLVDALGAPPPQYPELDEDDELE